jgi:hypothetical protein
VISPQRYRDFALNFAAAPVLEIIVQRVVDRIRELNGAEVGQLAGVEEGGLFPLAKELPARPQSPHAPPRNSPGCSRKPFSLGKAQNGEFREGQAVLTSLSRSG